MEGKCELFNMIRDITDYKIENNPKGFNIYPLENITVKIHCFEPLGWNVFIESDDIFEDNEILSLYSKLEGTVDFINYKYYNQDENIEGMLEENLRKIDNFFKQYSGISKISRNSLEYSILFNKIEKTNPKMTIKYSIREDIWDIDIKNFFQNGNMTDNLFEIYNKVVRLIHNFNKSSNHLVF